MPVPSYGTIQQASSLVNKISFDVCSKIAHFSFMFFERFALEFAEIAEEQ